MTTPTLPVAGDAMAHDRTSPECEERFMAIDGQLRALSDLAQATARTVRGENGTPGLVTAQALVAQKLGDLEKRLGDVEDKLDEMASTPHEVRRALEAKLDEIADKIQAMPPGGSSSSIAAITSPAFRVALAAIGVVGTVLAILAAVLGVQIGGGP